MVCRSFLVKQLTIPSQFTESGCCARPSLLSIELPELAKGTTGLLQSLLLRIKKVAIRLIRAGAMSLNLMVPIWQNWKIIVPIGPAFKNLMVPLRIAKIQVSKKCPYVVAKAVEPLISWSPIVPRLTWKKNQICKWLLVTWPTVARMGLG